MVVLLGIVLLKHRTEQATLFGDPTHFLKSWVSVIRNNFLEYRSEQATLFGRRNDFYALFAKKTAKHMLNRHFA